MSRHKPQVPTQTHAKMPAQKPARVPALRFKGFRGEWEERKLGEVADFLKGRGLAKSDIVDNGVLPCIRYGELYTYYNEVINNVISHTNLNKDSLILSKANDVIIPSSGETQNDIATASCVLHSGIALGGDLNIIRTEMNGIFLSYYLNHAKKRDIALISQGISVIHLYSSQLEKLRINIPTSEEQQKIADCLCSLDALIEAQRKKLEALKAHKKGLMQKLFPQEGKTKPALRFKGFSGEWEEKKLGDIGETFNGLSGKKSNDFGSGSPYVQYKQVFNRSYIDFTECGKVSVTENENQYILQKGDVLFTVSSETPNEVGFSSTITKQPKEATYLNSFCFALRPFDLTKNHLGFYRYLFRSPTYRKLITAIAQGSTRYNLSKRTFLGLKLLLPNFEEQQKIADCLSSLDNLIEAQRKKIEVLKTHKKGLMQQLFVQV